MMTNLLKTFVEEYGIKELPVEWLQQAASNITVAENPIKVVSSDPTAKARVCFISGPSIGEEGRQLLEKAITAGMGLKRNEVHICSVVGSEEGYLFQDQIERIQPEVVVALGVEAHNMLVGSGSKDSAGNIASVRGEWLSFQGVALMPTFNPTYLLTNPAAKREFWLDLQQVMKKLGLEKPV